MKKTILFAIGLLSCTIPVSNAFTVVVNDFSGSTASPPFAENVIRTSAGQPIATGAGRVRIGFFPTMTAAQVDTMFNVTDRTVLTNINANFVPLGEAADPDLGGPGGTGGASPPRFATRTVDGTSRTGRLAGSFVNINISSGAFNPANITGVPAGTRLYLLIYDAASDGATNQVGIFSAEDPTWLTPSDNLVTPNVNTVDVNSGAEVFLGSTSAAFPNSLLLTTLVPEPSTALFGLLTGLSLLIRRKR